MDTKEEVRSRLAIEEVISEYVPLKRAGRNWKGLSPFSHEKTPSFFVSPDKAIWHDFSSNKGGDIFSFVMEVEGLDFRAALELLARKAGVDMSQYETRSDGGLGKRKQRLYSLLDTAATYYQRALIQDPGAIDYASKQRGLDKNSVVNFRIGYAPPSGTALLGALRKRGYIDKELRDGGLVADRRSGLNDLFRERLMIPLSDRQGQVIGFTARLMRVIEKAPKYINTPQTVLYDKSAHVFGLYQAKKAIREEGFAVVVEGNLDVISSHQAGVMNVVATAGTALTDKHLRELQYFTDTVAFSFDADRAGIEAAKRAIPMSRAMGMSVKMVVMPGDYKDPDELVKADPELWRTAIKNAIDIAEWLIEAILTPYADRLDDPNVQEKIVREVVPVIAMYDSRQREDHYVRMITKRAGTIDSVYLQNQINAHRENGSGDQPRRLRSMKHELTRGGNTYAYQDFLLGLALMDPSVHDSVRKLDLTDLEGVERQAILGYILDNTGEALPETLPSELQPYETYVKIVLFKAETRYQAVDSPERVIEAASLVRTVKKEQRKQTKDQLLAELRAAETSADEEALARLRRKLADVIKEEKHAPGSR